MSITVAAKHHAKLFCDACDKFGCVVEITMLFKKKVWLCQPCAQRLKQEIAALGALCKETT